MSLRIGAIPGKGRLKVRQSPTSHMPPIPMRACFFANSGGGKNNLIIHILTKPKLFGGNVVDAVWVISPSVKVDSTWEHVRAYLVKRGQGGDEFFMEMVKQILDEGVKMTDYHKKRAKEGNHF